jgi:hypothetical protein
MAYSLQQAFANNNLQGELISFIEERADAIWAEVVQVPELMGGA